ncbi:ABC transporter ATP-binding protein [Frigidibacter sp. MR17.24]|uniref:ABC transporter ATP-binding protein n=1 Tax=Frigidibacter sp. MR17.24 TaxID=3127345 RepID=UPI003012C38A
MTAPGLRLTGQARFGAAPLFPPLDFSAPAGRWTCLLGPSGVGKSTILRLFAGLETGAEFDGTVAADDGRALAGRLAMMAQDDLLLPWLDAMGNLGLGARLRGGRPDRDRARDTLARVGLAGAEARLPSELSGGQRQRLALARVLMEDRPVVLLDEPFSALDAGTRARMQALAAEVLTGRTVLLVTHDAAEAARMGERIWHLTAGGLEDLGAPTTPLPRAPDAPEVLATQARLLRALMAEEA